MLLAAWAASHACLSSGAEINPAALPPASDVKVDFLRDIQPILSESCLRCHGPAKPKSGFRLDRKAAALEGGANGVAIVEGDSARSPLIHYVSGLVEDMEMPPTGKGDRLTPAQIGLLRAWIDQGLVWPEPEPAPPYSMMLNPLIGGVSIDGDKEAFREHHWMKDGWQGGVQDFRWTESVQENVRLDLSGHVLRHDYKVALEVEERDLWFVRSGYSEYRKYYDESGGWYAPFGDRTFELDQSLGLDMGAFWFEVGLTKPGLPRVVAGYDYEFKSGDKSSLQWRPITLPGLGGVPATRSILPSAKEIDEDVHRLHLEASQQWAGIDVNNRLQWEYFSLNNERRGAQIYPADTSGNFTETEEDHSQHQLANTLTAQKQVKDWLLLSSGYLYSRTEGQASLRQQTVDAAGNPALGNYWSGHGIDLDQWTHAGSASAQLGPWQHLSFTAAVQPEWSHQEGFGPVRYDEGLPPLVGPAVRPAVIDGDIDRFAVDEDVGLRYAGLPYTVLFAESRLRQESISQFESKVGGPVDTVNDFRRDTDATIDAWDYRGGFHVSPWRSLALSSHYRRVMKDRHYDHDVDEVPPGFFNGYSAFILDQDTDTDEVEAKLVWKPRAWIKSALSYQWVETEFDTRTAASFPFAPGGKVDQSGLSRSHVYGLSLTLAPLPRLYLAPAFTWSRTRMKSYDNGSAAVVPYEGDIYTVLSTATYMLNEKTDLTATYAFSQANYAQNNDAGGLPVGIEYSMHSLLAGVRRRINQNVTAQLQYGFYHYDEPSTGGQNDYDAHAVFSSLSLKLP